ncbi:metallophosphoesterase family protein [Breznakiella homolactica]|nr:exonuclease subunit SbcD [Breznakiella homolactica]
MKLLHTADLHLGRLFHERSLIEDQRYILNQLTDILAEDPHDGLIIAGDIYDRSIPSPEAVTLFGEFLGNIRRRFPLLPVFIIPGNHDSAARLGFGTELFSKLGVHINADPEASAEPVIIDAGGERCAVFLLPFLTPGSLSPERARQEGQEGAEDVSAPVPIRSQAKLAEEASLRLEEAVRKVRDSGVQWAVLAGHLFTLGGVESDSERIFLGTAEQVDVNLFKTFDYVALGHLHRSQQAAPNTWYSGSPLVYSFGETNRDKVFLSAELKNTQKTGKPETGELFGRDGKDQGSEGPPRKSQVTVTPIPVSPLRKLTSLSGTFDYFYKDTGGAFEQYKNDYLEISLTDRRLVENPLALLRPRFPYIMSVKQGEAFTAYYSKPEAVNSTVSASGGEKTDILDDFRAFLEDIYGQGDPEKESLFRDFAEELNDETS